MTKKIFIGLIIILLIILYIFVFIYLDKEIALGILAVSSTILISVLSVIISKHYERKIEILRENRNKKIPIYEELMSFIFRILFWKDIGAKQPTKKDINKFLNNFTQKLIVWGSDSVLKKYYLFKQVAFEREKEELSEKSVDIIFFLEDLILEIRCDLGHKNKDIKRGEILGLFISGVKEILN